MLLAIRREMMLFSLLYSFFFWCQTKQKNPLLVIITSIQTYDGSTGAGMVMSLWSHGSFFYATPTAAAVHYSLIRMWHMSFVFLIVHFEESAA
jgi:hypothetical protein